jgi:hypothetical protein
MTVSSTTTRVTYTGNGVTIAFATTFPFFTAGEIEVIERVAASGAETVKALTTHYTVSGGNGATGTVTAVGGAPPSTVQWVLRRKTARTQEIDYTPNDPFPAETHEQGLDRLKMNVQELGEENDRALKFPKSDASGLSGTIPSSVARANRVLAFDSSGAPVVSNQTLSGLEAPADAVAAAAAASASAAAASGSAGSAAASAAAAAATAASIGLPAAVASTMLRRKSDNTAYETRSFQQVFDDIHQNGADIASAATVNLDNATGDAVVITGTTTIGAITLAPGRERRTYFNGGAQLTHSASLVLPGAASIATGAGDIATWRGYPGGIVICVQYERGNGQALVITTSIFSAKVTSSNQTFPASGATLTWAHALGAAPFAYDVYAQNITTEGGWASSDPPVRIGSMQVNTAVNAGFASYADGTNVYIVIGSSGLYLPNKTNGTAFAVTAANWRIVIKAWL